MSGIASKLQHDREKSHGIGSNSHAVKYLNQDFESLRRSCLERGQLFQDDSFEALPSSLGYKDLGPNSSKVRGITWKRPKVSTISRWKHPAKDSIIKMKHFSVCITWGDVFCHIIFSISLVTQ